MWQRCRPTSAIRAIPRNARCCWSGKMPPPICPSVTNAASSSPGRSTSEQAPGMGDEATIQNRLFIDGEFVEAVSRTRIPVYNPHDNSLITEVAEATQPDIDRAVE